MIIAVVGSGGKTTRIHRLTEKYRKAGKKVFVTTTTHMYREDGCDTSGNAAQIQEKLNVYGYCMAGLPAENATIKACEELRKKICMIGAGMLEVDAETGEIKLVDFVSIAELQSILPL